MEEIKRSVQGGKVRRAQRLKILKEGVKKGSETVMNKCEEENIPTKVFLGFLSYPVRVYSPKPMRCFNCQQFGHIAKNCKEQRRSARCGGGVSHEYGKCGAGVQPQCCNCGVAHNVEYGECVITEETQIQKNKSRKNDHTCRSCQNGK